MKNNILMIYRHASNLIVAGLVFFLVACDDKGPGAENKAVPASVSAPESKNVADMDNNKDRTSVLDGRLTVQLPEGYQKMERKMIAELYRQRPVREHPKEIWYRDNNEGRVVLSFATTDKIFKESALGILTNAMAKEIAPGLSRTPQVTQTTINGKKIYRIEMIHPGVNGEETLGFIQPWVVEGKLWIIGVTLPLTLKEKYMKEAEDILSSLE